MFGIKNKCTPSVPGWNNLVKEYYDASWEAFLGWRDAGSRRDGPIALYLRISRAVFKRVFKYCKKREEETRLHAIATKYRIMEVNNFWGEINCVRSNRERMANPTDGLVGAENIVKMWRNYFTSKLFCLEDSKEAVILNEQMGDCAEVARVNTSASEIKKDYGGPSRKKRNGFG